MKKILFFVCCLFFVLQVKDARASHGMAADITYTCLNSATNSYQIEVVFYRDCSGITPSTPSISLNGSCGVIASPTMTLQPGYPVEVSQICATATSNCSGGSLQGVQEYVYQGTVTLPDGCDSILVTYSECCRSGNITNITSASSADLFVETMINTNQFANPATECNSSPTFSNIPVIYTCSGQGVLYNHGATDPDGDSLVYSIVNTFDAHNVPTTFAAGFSTTIPLDLTGAFVFDPATGQMTFTPTAGVAQIANITVRIEQYRNGVYIGYTLRDVLVVVLNNCTNSVPETGTDSISNVGGSSVTGTTFNTCPGNLMTFSITAGDSDVGQTLNWVETATSNLPGATITTSGTNPLTLHVTWPVPLVPLSSYNFSVLIEDDACPVPGTQVLGFTVNTTGFVQITTGDTTLCTNEFPFDIQLVANSGGVAGTYQWSPTTGLSDPNIPNPVAINVSGPIDYVCTFTASSGSCVGTDTANISERIVMMNMNPTTVNFCPGDPAVQLRAEMFIDGVLVDTVGDVATFTPDQTLPLCHNIAGGTHSLTYSTTQDAINDVTINICMTGDYGTPSVEFFDIIGEGGVNLGSYNSSAAGYIDCATTAFCNTVTIPMANWNSWNNDGIVSLTVNSSASVDFCTDFSCVQSADLSLPVPTGTTFPSGGVCGLDATTACSGATATYQAGTGTLTTGTGTPYEGYWHDGRVVYLYTAAELTALGLSEGLINSLAFDVSSKGSTQSYADFTIRMGCTNATFMPATFPTVTDVVFNGTVTTSTGINTHIFNTPYMWDGVSNLYVEVCFNNSSYTSDDDVRYTTTTFTSVIYDYQDNGPAGCNLSGPATTSNRPNTYFGFCPVTPATGIPVTQQYTDHYTWTPSLGLNRDDAYDPMASPATNTVYTCTGIMGGCMASRTVSVTCPLLSVECNDFKAKEENNQVVLDWYVDAEEDNEGFMIERLDQSGHAEQIAWVASKGNTNIGRNYSYTDTEIRAGTNYYYRLSRIELDGTESYICDLAHIRTGGEAIDRLMVYPNPTKGNLDINFYSMGAGAITVEIYDVWGRRMQHIDNLGLHEGYNTYSVNLTNYTPGMYTVKVGNQEIGYKTKRVIKN
ncbi:MAG: T9SS type A sorting domain-containing protein [Saprospiraceae bacterium]|nr:T9SS type A sorting domain-containing protein [Saprospiraceae bacterium]